jgi:hypothetical protein
MGSSKLIIIQETCVPKLTRYYGIHMGGRRGGAFKFHILSVNGNSLQVGE